MAVTCPYCSKHFPNSDIVGPRHKGGCVGWSAVVPKTPPCLCGYEAPSTTKMSQHRRTCEVWASRDKKLVQGTRWKVKVMGKYGTTTPLLAPEIAVKSRATNQERYGANNPFSKESSLYVDIEAKRAPKRGRFSKGADNPMNNPGVKLKQMTTLQQKYGVDYPLQSPAIRERYRQTCLERYGVEAPMCNPEIKEKTRLTNEERFGGPAPSCSPDVIAKMKATMLDRWGTENASHSFVIREVTKVTLLQRYGVDHPAKIDGFWSKVMGTMVQRYGQDPFLVIQIKRRETNQAKYGVDNPNQSPEVRERNAQTCLVKYGSPTYFGSETFKQANIAKYGFPSPMQNREYAGKHQEKIRRPGPNAPERLLHKLAPELQYTGDGSFWRWLPLLDQHKNPDFIVPGPDPEHPKKGVTKVVELFGDFWHSRMFTGKVNFEHESELVAAFAGVGIQCLVVWESEVKKNPTEVQMRVASFCAT